MKTYIRVRFHQRVSPNGKTSLLRETTALRGGAVFPILLFLSGLIPDKRKTAT